MLNDDELGMALGDAFRMLVSDIEPSRGLLERIDSEIGADVAARQRGGCRTLSRRLRRRLLVAVPVPIAAVVATVIVLAGTAAAPSYAVIETPTASVRVSIDDLIGVTKANARLRAAGVDSVVVVPMSATCTTHVDLSRIGTREHPAPKIRVVPSPLPANTTVVLGAEQLGPIKIEIAFGRVTGQVPSCLSSKGTGPGLPGWQLPVHKLASKTTTSGVS
jgi:hypothetical protein